VKTKSKIGAYILRCGAAMLLFSCGVVALSSAINTPNHPPKFLPPQNDAAFGVNGHEGTASASATRRNRTLTFADRVAYQRAIEEVYWRHRIWPAVNAGPKPPLDKVMSQAEIEKKVEDYLRKCEALEDYWQRPITASEFQAEMERMAQHTKQPDVLRELFAALGNDPFVIAECLVRPVLAQRLSADLTVVAGVPPAPRGLSTADTAASTDDRLGAQTNRDNAAYRLPEISTDCAEDTWTATAIVNAPDAREFHTVVWTGGEMIMGRIHLVASLPFEHRRKIRSNYGQLGPHRPQQRAVAARLSQCCVDRQ
jgi:hypothetical protein